jgi:hypothetical protein
MKTASAAIESAGESKGDAAPPMRLCVGPLAVKADTAEVATFRHATMDVAETGGLGMLPFTFPVRWLARPEIRAAVARLVSSDSGAALLPLHESQTFDYTTPLFAGVDYCMSVDICMAGEKDSKNESDPARLILRADIGPEANTVHLRMEMVLRLVATGEDVSDASKPGSTKTAGL